MGNAHDDNWADDPQGEIDLRLENQSLETELKLQGATQRRFGEVPFEVHNQFLKNVLAFEEAAKKPPTPVRSLFPDNYPFPPAESMSPQELRQKLEDMERTLGKHNVGFGFAKELPDALLYKHLVEEVIPNDTVTTAAAEGFAWYLDGCTGRCEDCFQNRYCTTGREILEKIEREKPSEQPGADYSG
jgi:hypothetical protein